MFALNFPENQFRHRGVVDCNLCKMDTSYVQVVRTVSSDGKLTVTRLHAENSLPNLIIISVKIDRYYSVVVRNANEILTGRNIF